MKRLRTVVGIVVVAAALGWSHGGCDETDKPSGRSSNPYVATRHDVVRDMLRMADTGKDDVVYDLGSGDGRIVIAAVRDFGARRAVGIENDPNRILESRQNARKAGVTERVELIQGDVFAADFGQAGIVTVFLDHRQNIKLRAKMLRILEPGTRIVSHQFGMGEWQPDKTVTIREVRFGMYATMWSPYTDNPRVPDYTANELSPYEGDRIFMWVVPAPVAGMWRGKVETAEGPQDLQLILHQRLSRVDGRFQLAGKTNLAGRVRADLWGDHLRFWCRPDGMSDSRFEMRLDGHVHENTMRGKLTVTDRGKLQEGTWQAQREKVDFAGTWQWPCATGPRSVRLRIEQRDGQFTATYLDRGQALPVTDFYDFAGGFYFTLMIGREGNSTRITEDTGWLIGEGILDDGELKGRIEFYPYRDPPGVPDERKAREPMIKDWAPRLINERTPP